MQCRETPQCFTESTETRQVSDLATLSEVGQDRATGTAERIERNVEGSEEGQQNGIVIGGAIFVRSSRALTALGALAWTDAFRGPEEILKGVVEYVLDDSRGIEGVGSAADPKSSPPESNLESSVSWAMDGPGNPDPQALRLDEPRDPPVPQALDERDPGTGLQDQRRIPVVSGSVTLQAPALTSEHALHVLAALRLNARSLTPPSPPSLDTSSSAADLTLSAL
ncbi:hypothetical protein A1Q2_04269 [Trichosporon asahii var. asahii CBS 8904]|uniref:Uncharacterized protein n=2 Tax=Trichosporon asahii var. asahii TaxID=189963 RepID=K1VPM6_TRIAC|nr:hypothetical protein A1Q1_03466 [Trichosporon asahii var. asahii CBS 2479]EJT47689.1 hypothetical protein A1Q1_03466 [Trichosporon asahii var. asahii CBS 2479]EKD01427.1 hypothetical protein A1Q2_04269 [Trichosporon asahii var. asahii CBS 8904]